jgi:hypothetical protein
MAGALRSRLFGGGKKGKDGGDKDIAPQAAAAAVPAPVAGELGEREFGQFLMDLKLFLKGSDDKGTKLRKASGSDILTVDIRKLKLMSSGQREMIRKTVISGILQQVISIPLKEARGSEQAEREIIEALKAGFEKLRSITGSVEINFDKYTNIIKQYKEKNDSAQLKAQIEQDVEDCFANATQELYGEDWEEEDDYEEVDNVFGSEQQGEEQGSDLPWVEYFTNGEGSYKQDGAQVEFPFASFEDFYKHIAANLSGLLNDGTDADRLEEVADVLLQFENYQYKDDVVANFDQELEQLLRQVNKDVEHSGVKLEDFLQNPAGYVSKGEPCPKSLYKMANERFGVKVALPVAGQYGVVADDLGRAPNYDTPQEARRRSAVSVQQSSPSQGRAVFKVPAAPSSDKDAPPLPARPRASQGGGGLADALVWAIGARGSVVEDSPQLPARPQASGRVLAASASGFEEFESGRLSRQTSASRIAGARDSVVEGPAKKAAKAANAASQQPKPPLPPKPPIPQRSPEVLRRQAEASAIRFEEFRGNFYDVLNDPTQQQQQPEYEVLTTKDNDVKVKRLAENISQMYNAIVQKTGKEDLGFTRNRLDPGSTKIRVVQCQYKQLHPIYSESIGVQVLKGTELISMRIMKEKTSDKLVFMIADNDIRFADTANESSLPSFEEGTLCDEQRGVFSYQPGLNGRPGRNVNLQETDPKFQAFCRKLEFVTNALANGLGINLASGGQAADVFGAGDYAVADYVVTPTLPSQPTRPASETGRRDGASANPDPLQRDRGGRGDGY